MKITNVIFTRHKLTPKQVAEIPQADETVDCSDLASQDITTLQDAEDILKEIISRTGGNILKIYGVIPTPLRAILYEQSKMIMSNEDSICLEVYEAFNVKRSEEGGKPTFEHAGWLLTGRYIITI